MIAFLAQNAIRAVDAGIARAYLSIFKERNGLLPILFHSLFRDEAEIAKNVVDPLDRTTVSQFRQLIEYYLETEYRFVSPDDVLRGLDPEHRYVMLTFDDGYFNNTLALPVLEEFNLPAIFFISTNHVREGKCFWWDVLYRECIAAGMPPKRVYQEALALKDKRTEDIEVILRHRFGPDALVPRGDIDRPFKAHELQQFARHPCVHLGNHTADHAILTNYSTDEARKQGRRPAQLPIPTAEMTAQSSTSAVSWA
jgi:peptidoglycan/xylan/chitin deacetylase (PgdA/CDA1 family)